MAKNQHSSNSSGGCVKLYKASLSTIRIDSNSPQNSIPVATTALNPPLPTTKSTTNTDHISRVKPASTQLPSSGEVIPIEFDPQLLLTLQNYEENSAKHPGSFQNTNQPAKVSTNVSIQEKKLEKKESMTDKFSNYINRVKNRMRTASDIGGAKISSGSDFVSSYTRSAKMKTRTAASTGGGGKSVSFK